MPIEQKEIKKETEREKKHTHNYIYLTTELESRIRAFDWYRHR